MGECLNELPLFRAARVFASTLDGGGGLPNGFNGSGRPVRFCGLNVAPKDSLLAAAYASVQTTSQHNIKILSINYFGCTRLVPFQERSGEAWFFLWVVFDFIGTVVTIVNPNQVDFAA